MNLYLQHKDLASLQNTNIGKKINTLYEINTSYWFHMFHILFSYVSYENNTSMLWVLPLVYRCKPRFYSVITRKKDFFARRLRCCIQMYASHLKPRHAYFRNTHAACNHFAAPHSPPKTGKAMHASCFLVSPHFQKPGIKETLH